MTNTDLIRLLDRVTPEAPDMGCYQLDNAMATVLIGDAIRQGYQIRYYRREGFLSISLEEFISQLDDTFYCVFKGEFGRSYFSDDALLTVGVYDGDDRYTFTLLTYNNEKYDLCEKLCATHIQETKKNTVFALSHGMDGFYLSPLGKLNAPIIRENYNDEVVQGFDFVTSDFVSSNPHGRLAIINGPPGTGKTYLIKGLVSELENSTVIIIPPRLISEIDGPSLLPTFIDHRRKNKSSIILIIEDADACLAPRQSDNISSITSLLNCADGILGSMLDIKIIATTNQDKMEFDAALTRPGRLSRHIEVNELPADQATKVHRRLIKDFKDSLPEFTIPFSYEEPQTLAQIYIDADVTTGGKLKGGGKKNVQPAKGMKRRMGIGFQSRFDRR